MSMLAQEAYDEIVAHIQEQGGAFSDWYAGITENIKERLHGAHKVPEKGHWFIHRKCVSDEAARAVEEALLDKGCDGGDGGGDEDAVRVYAYLKTSITKP